MAAWPVSCGGLIVDPNMALTFVSRTIKLIAILAVGVSPYCAVASSVAPTKTSNYVIDKNVVIHADDGATLCALVVRPASAQRSPTALEFTIYVDPKKDLSRLEYAAIRGYAGVMAYTRGKGEWIRQTQKVWSYEDASRGANTVMDRN